MVTINILMIANKKSPLSLIPTCSKSKKAETIGTLNTKIMISCARICMNDFPLAQKIHRKITEMPKAMTISSKEMIGFLKGAYTSLRRNKKDIQA